MRENASSFMIKVLLGIIVLAFVFMGVGSFREEKASRIASVNDDPISFEEYQKVYRNILERFRNQYGNKLNDDMIKMFNLKQRAMDSLIQEKIILQQADRLGLKVTDEELTESIRNLQAFQTDGRFDVNRYTSLLGRLQLEPAEFEADQKKMLLADKLNNLITGSIRVSEEEAREWFNWENALVNLDVVQFLPSDYADIKTTSEELKEYYDENQSKYKTQPALKVRYAHFPTEKYKAGVDASDDEIELYYQDNKDDFFNPKTVEARHILLKVDPEADDETVSETKEKALNILEKVKKGDKTFAELAKTYSEGPSRAAGGQLGSFKREDMVKPFSDKAFSMSEGDVSEPVRTNFGWHIIKVEKINEAYSSRLDSVKTKISDSIIGRKAKTAAYDEAMDIFEVSFEGDDLIRETEKKGIELKTTDFFTRSGPKEIRDRGIFARTAFNLDEGQVSDVLEVKDGFYILQVIEKKPAGISPFEDVKEKVEKDLLSLKQKQKAKEDAESFLAELKKENDLKGVGDAFGKKIISTGFIKRNDSIPDIGREQKINEEAFKLSKENNVPEKVIEGLNGYYVIMFKDRKTPEPQEFEKEKDTISESLLIQKKNRLFEKWLTALKDKSEIFIEKDFL